MGQGAAKICCFRTPWRIDEAHVYHSRHNILYQDSLEMRIRVHVLFKNAWIFLAHIRKCSRHRHINKNFESGGDETCDSILVVARRRFQAYASPATAASSLKRFLFILCSTKTSYCFVYLFTLLFRRHAAGTNYRNI